MRHSIVYIVQRAEVLIQQAVILFAASMLVAGLVALGGALWRLSKRLRHWWHLRQVRNEILREKWELQRSWEEAQRHSREQYPKLTAKGRKKDAA